MTIYHHNYIIALIQSTEQLYYRDHELYTSNCTLSISCAHCHYLSPPHLQRILSIIITYHNTICYCFLMLLFFLLTLFRYFVYICYYNCI